MDIFYDKKTFVKALTGLVVVMALMNVTGGFGFAIVVPLSLYAALKGNITHLFYWLIVSNCMLMGNHVLMPKDLTFALCQRGMMVLLGCGMAAKAFGGRNPITLTPIFGIFIYVCYMIIPSMTGWSPVVSILKLILFVTVFCAYIGTAKKAIFTSHEDMIKFRSIILAAAAFFLVGSIIVMPFTAISYLSAEELLRNPDIVSLFKGMTWHSQTLGPLVATLCVFLVGDLVFNIRKVDKFYLMMIANAVLLVYKSSSRTGMGTMLAGIMFIGLQFMNARGVKKAWRAKVVNFMLIFGMLFSAGVAVVPSVREKAIEFILKQEKHTIDSTTTIESEAVLATRQFLMDEEIANWKESPAIGNGFQVSKNMINVQRSGLLSYLSAPIEKGVWVTAILEEGGVVGLVLFILFWLPATCKLWARHVYVAAALLIANVVCNLAEFCMFSMSSEGGFVWGVYFAAVILDTARITADRYERRYIA